MIKNVARFGKNLFFHDALSNLDELEGEQQNRKIRSKATTFYPLCNKPHSVKQEIETFRDFPKERKRREKKKREKKKIRGTKSGGTRDEACSSSPST